MNAETTPSRGEATREALIRAAIEIFGRDGFNAAGTRALAEAAGVNQALIAYHFGSKAGLYLAALQHIVGSVRERIGPLLATIEAELDGANPERCLAMLLQLLDGFVVLLTGEESGTWARLILKEQQDPSEGFDVLYEGVMSRVIGITTSLIGRIRNIDPESDAANLLGFTIFGQVLVFRTGRATVERRTGWRQFNEHEIAAVQAQIHRNVTAILMQENPE